MYTEFLIHIYSKKQIIHCFYLKFYILYRQVIDDIKGPGHCPGPFLIASRGITSLHLREHVHDDATSNDQTHGDHRWNVRFLFIQHHREQRDPDDAETTPE